MEEVLGRGRKGEVRGRKEEGSWGHKKNVVIKEMEVEVVEHETIEDSNEGTDEE